MYFDSFTQLLVFEEGDKDLYALHKDSGKSLNTISREVLLDENLSRKSSLEGVLSSNSFPLSDTTSNNKELNAWRAECIRRVNEPGFAFSRPWIFQASSGEKLHEETLALFPFHTSTSLTPVFITEDMVQENTSFNTFLVNSGVVCVLQRKIRGSNYKPFSHKVFKEGGSIEIYSTYTQGVITVNRSYIIIGITTEEYPSAINLAEVLLS